MDRVRRQALFLRRALGHMPLTWSLVGLLWLLGAVTGSLLQGPPQEVLGFAGLELGPGTRNWWAAGSSAFFGASLLDYGVATLALLAGVGLAERALGRWAAAASFLAGNVVASLLLVALIDVGTAEDNAWLTYLGGDYVVGPYGGAAAALGAATAALSVLWRRRLRTWLLALALMFLLFVGVAQTVQLAAGAVLGVAVGSLVRRLRRHPGDPVLHRSSVRESRFLIGTVVGVFALGPLLTQLTGTFLVGPLSAVSALTLQVSPDAADLGVACNADPNCEALQSAVGLTSPGAVVLTLIPVLLLLLVAEGLRRGRLLALRMALTIHGFLAAVVLGTVLLYTLEPQVRLDSEGAGLLTLYLLPSVLAPTTIFVLLLANRRKFPVRSARNASRLLARTSLALAGATVAVYLLCWWAEGNPADTGLDALPGQLLHILIPFPLPFVVQLPHGLFSTIVFSFGGAACWLVLLALVLRSFLRFRRLGEEAGDRARARELLHVGGGSLSWMALWRNNSYWFTPGAEAALAYQVRNGVALTVGGPFGAPDAYPAAVRGFLSHCRDLGLVPCFYSVPETHGQDLAGAGFQRLEVAEETLLMVRDMSFTGKEWQNVRTAMNRARKLGILAVWSSYADLPPLMRTQLSEISEEWVADQALPEMGFTLGGLAELQDPEVLCCLAVDEEGLVHAVTSWLPVFDGGRQASWTLDFMRRRKGAFKGVMEFLIASAVTRFREDVTSISLSGSPLARRSTPATGDRRALDQVLALLADALEPLYGFQSLAAFKSRFQPEHRTLYMYYPDPLALPSIGLAVTNAYLPELTPRQRAGLLRRLVNQP
jgi:phosphatidylglycerol lysyltransferase